MKIVPKKFLLQFPEGLKAKALELADRLERQGKEVFISASPCYGACDVAFDEAEKVDAQRIIHFGHSGVFAKGRVDYEEFRMKVDFKGVLGRALKEMKKFKRVGLVTTVQHVGQLSEMKKFLERKGKKVFIGRHGKFSRYNGQVLGCDLESARGIERKVDCFLYFGGGVFHPLSVALEVRKPVLAVDPFSRKVFWLFEEKEKREKLKKGMLTLAANAKNFGVIVSTKPGQFNLKSAKRLKGILEGVGKKAYVLVCNDVNFESLKNFAGFDCFVITACPRLVDDYEKFGKPVLSGKDVRELVELLKS